MAVNCTLEDLLNLALGTPEIGAVNFNYLHEVLHEILKHLGISKKVARRADHVDYAVRAVSGGSTPLSDVPGAKSYHIVGGGGHKGYDGHGKKDGRLNSKPHDGGISGGAGSKTHEGGISGGANSESHDGGISGGAGSKTNEGGISGGTGVETSKGCISGGATEGLKESGQGADGTQVRRSSTEKVTPDDHQGGSNTENQIDVTISDGKADESKVSSQNNSYNEDNEDKGDEDDGKMTEKQVPSSKEAPGEKQSLTSPRSHRVIYQGPDYIPTRNSPSPPPFTAIASTGSAGRRYSLIIGTPDSVTGSNRDFYLVNRNLECKESKTPAGDMWHILNINRRLEAAEVTIQGMSKMIDNVISDVSDVKGTLTGVVNKQEESINDETEINENLASLANSIKLLEEKNEAAVDKTDIKDFCTVSMVEAIVDEKLQGVTVGTRSNTGSPKKSESRSKLVTEFMARLINLEEANTYFNDEIEKLKSELENKAAKADLAIISNIEAQLKTLMEELQALKENDNAIKNLQNDISEISDQQKCIKNTLEQKEREQQDINKTIEKTRVELEDLTDSVYRKMQRGSSSLSNVRADNDALAKIRTMITKLQEEHRVMNAHVHGIDRDLERKQNNINNLYDLVEELKDSKLDKSSLGPLLDKKADKSDLEDKITQSQFDTCIGNLDRNLQDIMQRVEGQDSVFKHAISNLEGEVARRVCIDDFNALKLYFEDRLNKFKIKIPEPLPPNDNAAGFRRPMLRNFNCISCDRPLELMQEDAIPALPTVQALPGTRALRPYTTFELEQIRQHMARGALASNKDRFELAQERERLQKQLLRLCGAHDFDDLSSKTARACGGTHTLLDPQRRPVMKGTMYYREDILTFQSDNVAGTDSEADVMGRDGHIYRGRVEPLPPLKDSPLRISHKETYASSVRELKEM